MEVARRAGLPVPRVICYAEHPDSPHAPVSTLMTRIPGDELGVVYKTLSDFQLKGYLEAVRRWKSPWGKNRVYSVLGTAIRSVRMPNHLAGPFESEQVFNEYLLRPAWSGGFPSETEYHNGLDRAKKMESMSHRFTHGDIKHHNLLMPNGKITGFLDWVSAGWCPEYWDFTTALLFAREDFWWYKFVLGLGVISMWQNWTVNVH
ncbi:phosphotransferase family protein [Aspergillus lucknowensis]|uniref:Phosphotransferase family protein n=1 Tax=Aspergillus lucknowensis TaxID=176173 RepID=A0ABR4LKI0_9EURO